MSELLAHWQPILVWASVGSVLALVATAFAVPWVITRLPADYFARAERKAWDTDAGAPHFTHVTDVLKNIVGAFLVLVGAIMLVTPGQGVLTILVGLLLMNFPGKYRLERWLVLRPGVLPALNWLRARRGQMPFSGLGDVEAAAQVDRQDNARANESEDA